MENSVEPIASIPTIQCANVNPPCQAANPQENKFCEKCGTPLIKRYVWAVGDGIHGYQPGELLGERYLLVAPRILLDLKPALPPQAPEELAKSLLPYLKLFPYRLHLPQVYGYLPSPQDQRSADIWLLEYGSVPLDSLGHLQYPNLLPEITEVWAQARDLRQLNWLEQMAQLWQPFQNQGVVSSLLNPFLLRVNGATLQLLELQPDPYQVPTFKHLGKLWSQWIPSAAPSLADFFPSLCQQLEHGKIQRVEQLLFLLKEAIAQCGTFYQRTYQVYTCTDAGPSRDHNEDACYPLGEELEPVREEKNRLTIVCDGIGGQDGGEIASQLAIETLVAEMTKFPTSPETTTPQNYHQILNQAICTTNDLISQRNDEENRHERQRMGTTLVMSLIQNHEMYLAHVGDSRIYWITPNSCHQVTVDDDLASREVRLGYLLYRDAIQYPNAGALVQALGMSNSVSLHPNVQRLILDEDCVCLLCSDGLSDYDRVDQYWESEIAPILRGETDVNQAGKRLLEIGNRQNGHDNVTVALISCQVKPQETSPEIVSVIFPENEITISSEGNPSQAYTDSTVIEDPTSAPTKATAIAPPPVSQKKFPLWLIGLSILGLGALGYGLRQVIISLQNPEPSPSPAIAPTPLPSPESLIAGEYIQIQDEVALDSLPPEAVFSVPQNSILKILKTPGNPDNPGGFQLQVCTIRSKGKELTSLGKKGWINAEILTKSRFSPISSEAPASLLGNCSPVESVPPATTATPLSP